MKQRKTQQIIQVSEGDSSTSHVALASYIYNTRAKCQKSIENACAILKCISLRFYRHLQIQQCTVIKLNKDS